MAPRGSYPKRSDFPATSSNAAVVSLFSDKDEAYIVEAIAAIREGHCATVAAAAYLISTSHFSDDADDHRRERERLRSKLRRILPERMARSFRP